MSTGRPEIARHPPDTLKARPAAGDFNDRQERTQAERVAALEDLARRRRVLLDSRPFYSREIERLVRSLVIPKSRVLELGCAFGDLLAASDPTRGVGVDVANTAIEIARERHPGLEFLVADIERTPLPQGPFDFVILSDVLGLVGDIQNTLEATRSVLAPGGRLIITYYNFLWEPVVRAAERLGLKAALPEQNWLSMQDVENLLWLAGFEVVRDGTDVLAPVEVPLVSAVANRIGARLPIVGGLSLVVYFVAKVGPPPQPFDPPRVSVVCPCRNERGNIAEAVTRTPVMGAGTELIFVDGGSTDGTIEEIERAIAGYKGPLELRLVHQGNGRGKGDAVRKGFDAARYEILMILDSDLTVSPEELPKFYDALTRQRGEFINGVRLVYPMEGEAMRFLNAVGNRFFSYALSWVLEQPIKDSLCGTKALYRRDWDRIIKTRDLLKLTDPFGDFDLLFGAARLNMKIVDVPIRYKARTYGETKIHRFRDGWQLLRMTAQGFRRLRSGR